MRSWIILAFLALALPAAAQAPREAGRLALVAASQNRWAEAEVAGERADPLIRKMLLWLRLQSRSGPYSSAEFVQFIEGSAEWPMLDTIARNAEMVLEVEPDDRLVLRWFAVRPARSVGGAWRQADALARTGRDREATEAARRGWAEGSPDATDEAIFLERHQARLTVAEHWARFNRLAYARDFPAAARVVPYLDAPRAQVAQLRLAFSQGDTGNAALAARDAGTTLERARALRLAGRDTEAAAAFAAGVPMQTGLPTEAARAIWAERQLQARRALRLNDARNAYELAAHHGQPGPGEARQEAEFLAGFVALRFLNSPPVAARHFAAVADGSNSAITLARAHYWRGRALAAGGNLAGAREAWTAAAAYPVAFYGQLAGVALGEAPDRLATRLRAVQQPGATAAQAATFQGREIARIVPMLAELGEGRRARLFLLRIEELATQPWERTLLMQLAARSGRTENPVWVARRSGAAGAMMVPDGWPSPYPTDGLPIEPALVNGITRQESNFDTEAVSPANARGLMQLLPATAQATARRIGVPYQLAGLQGNPALNMRLGSSYLAQMIDRFGGAWPYAIAAYNAGPGRVDEWLQTNGDARTGNPQTGNPQTGNLQTGNPQIGNPQMLDWMELIPFSETRNYVQRVMENVAVYRALGGVNTPHPMAAYLR